MERIKKGLEPAAWRHGYQAGELTVASWSLFDGINSRDGLA